MSCKPERKKEGRWVGGGRRSGGLPKDRFFALDRWAVQRGRPEVFWRDGIQETKREEFRRSPRCWSLEENEGEEGEEYNLAKESSTRAWSRRQEDLQR